MSKIIVIEGPDRVGKATQSRLLKQNLINSGFAATIVEVPVRTNPLYHFIYWMLRNGLAKKFPKFFQWNQYFNRRIFQWFDLPHLEKKYDYIIMDRWSLSSVIYGTVTGVPSSFTNKIYKKLRQPFHTFILLGASHKHEHEDVYEADSDLQKKVRDLYSLWAVFHKKDCTVVDCSASREDISQEICHKVFNM